MRLSIQTVITILIVLGSLAAAVLVLRGVDVGLAVALILQANVFYLVLALSATLASLAARVIRWKYALLPGEDVPYVAVTSALLISFLVGVAAVTGVGAVPRIYVLNRRTQLSVGFILGTMVQEVILDMTAILLIATILPFFVELPPFFVAVRVVLFLGLVLFLVFDLALVRHRSLVVTLLKRVGLWERLLGSLPGLLRGSLDDFSNGLGAVFFYPRPLSVVLVMTGVVWLASILLFWFLMLSLNIFFTIVQASLVTAYTNAVITAIAVPGFFGTLEASAITLTIVLGATPAAALAFTALLRVFLVVLPALIGAYFAASEGFRIGR